MAGLMFEKPAKGSARLERRERKAEIKAHEAREKAKVVKRDGAHYCRLVPGCTEKEWHETAHLENKGMGGDHGLRTDAAIMIRACQMHHTGPWSLHSGDIKVEYLDDILKADGPIQTWARDVLTGAPYVVGTERAVGVWQRD